MIRQCLANLIWKPPVVDASAIEPPAKPLEIKLQPDTEYRKRRLAQFTPERVWRYQTNAQLVNMPQLAAHVDAMRRQRLDGMRRLFWIDAVRLRK